MKSLIPVGTNAFAMRPRACTTMLTPSIENCCNNSYIFPRKVKQKNEIKKKVNGRKRGAEEKHTVSVWGIPIVLGW